MLRIETLPGDSIECVADEAVHVAEILGVTVVFTFNDVTLFVGRESQTDDIVRLYIDTLNNRRK